MRLEGYHGTSIYNGKLIIRYGFDLNKCVKRDDDWLGKGIYFFADKKYANWWANIKRKGMVLSSDIICDDNEFLDLDDVTDNINFLKQCLEYKNLLHCKFKNEHQCVNVLIDLYKEDYNISVVTRTFPVDGGRFVKLNGINNNIIRLTGLSLQQKQICVSNVSCILNVKEA